jgi:hypothetical protein
MSENSLIRLAETHRLLQECLLDIVAEKLEKICGGLNKKSATAFASVAVVTSPDDEVQTKNADDKPAAGTEEMKSEANFAPKEKKTVSSRPVGYKLNKISHQDEEIVQLLRLLSDMIRIINNLKQHLQSMWGMPG